MIDLNIFRNGGLAKFVIYSTLVLYSLSIILVLIWVLLTALKTNNEIFLSPWSLPGAFRIENFIRAYVFGKLGSGMINSLILTFSSVTMIIVFSTMFSYIVARFPSRTTKFLYTYVLIGLMTPIHSLMVPLFIQLHRINLVNTIFGVAIALSAFAFSLVILVMTNYIKETIPKDIEEAAIIDGCGLWGVFVNVIIPLTKPCIISLTVLQFILIWNDYIFSVLLISSDSIKTIPLRLTTFRGEYVTEYSSIFAGITIAIVPSMLFYIIFQNYISAGLTLGAVKQ